MIDAHPTYAVMSRIVAVYLQGRYGQTVNFGLNLGLGLGGQNANVCSSAHVPAAYIFMSVKLMVVAFEVGSCDG